MHSSINKRIKKQAAEDKMTMTAVKDQESIHETAHWINRTANSKHLEQSKPQVKSQKTITTRYEEL
ncbi:toxin-antitoxin system, antitoxin component, PHD domain protein [Enterococcus casseliflavus]|uniref:toxin-antitoxin system, antitoxin component, PHD domain protein n=1 Tax=Enterococcus casseliflavus TaxID=37734 RepID=UPI0009BEC17B|nr:toxin-antitoxin system, antitoxin component, PHD domain protein [Enterococcus casseliflavus]MBO6386971.1 toxin-antitoxin system, antitoxin component, PHD domain protein [Enterococcus casseliflavus]